MDSEEVSDSDTEVVTPVADEEIKSFTDLVINVLHYYTPMSFFFSLYYIKINISGLKTWVTRSLYAAEMESSNTNSERSHSSCPPRLVDNLNENVLFSIVMAIIIHFLYKKQGEMLLVLQKQGQEKQGEFIVSATYSYQ